MTTAPLRRGLRMVLAAVAVGFAPIAHSLPARAAGVGDGASEHAGAGPVYVKIDPITVTVFRDDGPPGRYSAALTIELAEPGQRAVVDAARARLRDALLRQLHVLVDREERAGREVTIDTVKHAMRGVARRELGRDVVVDLFVHAVLRSGA